MIKSGGLKAFELSLLAKIQAELPPNFFKLVYNQIATIDALGKIILVLALFFSFNFYSYMYIKGGLMQLERERLAEEKLNGKWNDLFHETDSYFVYRHRETNCKNYFVNFDPRLSSQNSKINNWATDALVSNQSYSGFADRMAVPITNLANTGAASVETILQLRYELSLSLFQLLKRKPNTSLFDNLLYFLWLPFDLDAKKRLLQYKQKELGEIVLEMLHKKAICSNIEQFQTIVLRSVLMDNLRWRRFVICNMQFLMFSSKSRHDAIENTFATVK